AVNEGGRTPYRVRPPSWLAARAPPQPHVGLVLMLIVLPNEVQTHRSAVSRSASRTRPSMVAVVMPGHGDPRAPGSCASNVPPTLKGSAQETSSSAVPSQPPKR